MAVNLSPVYGVAGQLFDNNGNPLAGGKIYTYLAGTTTPATTYTSSAGNIAHTNPIVLDGAGRVPSGEIWLTDGITYKFVVQDSANNLIGTYDNLTGINSNFVAYTNSQEIQTATAGQTVFNLATVTYQPGTNSLTVFVDGVNQYGPGAQYAYVETDSDTVTFVSGLHVGASVKFTTSQLNNGAGQTAAQTAFTGFKGQIGTVQDLANNDGSDWIGYLPDVTGGVAHSAQDKMQEVVSAFDFMTEQEITAVKTNTWTTVSNVTAAFQNAITYCHDNFRDLYVPAGTYKLTDTITKASSFYGVNIHGEGATNSILDFSSITAPGTSGLLLIGGSGSVPNNVIQKLRFKGNQNVRAIEFRGLGGQRVRDCTFDNFLVGGLYNNKDAGSFTEFDVFENCRFEDNCWLAIEYQRDLGDDSFHGSGLQDCIVGSSSSQLARIRINTGCKPYNAPMTATFFMNGTIPIIEHIETIRTATFYGHMKVETFSGTPTLASGYDVGLAGDVSFLGTAPNWGTLTLTRYQTSDVGGVLQSLDSMYVGQTTAINTSTFTDIYIPTGMVRGSRLIFVYLQGTFVEASYVLLSLVSPFGFFPTPTLIGKSVADNGGQSGADPVFALNNSTSALQIKQGGGPATDVTARVVAYQLGLGAANTGVL